MSESLLSLSATPNLLRKLSGLQNHAGDPRAKEVVQRIVGDLFRVMEELDVTPEEFWSAMAYLTSLGQANEAGLLAAGLGFEHLFDLLLERKERAAGLDGGTPRTIEGPLFLTGAPLSDGHARLDDGSEQGQVLHMRGQVRTTDGRPVAHAVVDVWHANTLGNYSHFDPAQSSWNLRRRIRTDAEGRYTLQSILPSGYGCPPGGPTERLLDLLGRHGRRPAHVHFMVAAAGFRSLTTQINIDGDAYLHNDFAFATRDGLIPPVTPMADTDGTQGLAIEFDFTLLPEVDAVPAAVVIRPRAQAA